MHKYTYKNNKILFLFLILFISCTSKKNITIQGCDAITGNTECNQLIKKLQQDIIKSTGQYRLVNNVNTSNEYISLKLLNTAKVDFSFLAYNFFNMDNNFKQNMKDIIPLKKLFFTPIFIVSQDNIKNIDGLQQKTIAIEKDTLNRYLSAENILKILDIKYTPVFSHSIDFPALFNDHKIDAYLCFETDCKTIIHKTAKISPNLNILNLPFHNTRLEYEKINLGKTIKNKKNLEVNTYGIWEYLVMNKDIDKTKSSLVLESLNRVLSKIS